MGTSIWQLLILLAIVEFLVWIVVALSRMAKTDHVVAERPDKSQMRPEQARQSLCLPDSRDRFLRPQEPVAIFWGRSGLYSPPLPHARPPAWDVS